jgi:AcrR family transcriptional regulator
MKKRAEAAGETRQRIVRATFELHVERGIAATSVRDIAARAGVSPGTVYHHFPGYDDVITACGQFAFATTGPPSHAIFAGLSTPADRLRRLVDETFAWYRRFPGYEKVRAERGAFAPLEQAFAHEEKTRRALIREALKPSRAGARAVAVAFTLLDISVYQRLVRSGLPHSAAVDEIHRLIERRLLDDGSLAKPEQRSSR